MEVLMGLVSTMLIEAPMVDSIKIGKTETCLQVKMELHILQLKFIRIKMIDKVREVQPQLVLLSITMLIPPA